MFSGGAERDDDGGGTRTADGDMRHSSSWPDRAPRAVRVRVDPLSRAFTVIPAGRETPRGDRPEEIVRSIPPAAGLAREREEAGSVTMTTRADDDDVPPRDRPRCRSDSPVRSGGRKKDVRRATSDTEVALRSPARRRSAPIAARTIGANDGDRRENAISAAPSPPRINVVDYDYGYEYATTASRRDRHACYKCTSESVLRSQIDPFRSPSAAMAMGARPRAADFGLPFGRKRRARAERGEASWHEMTCLIGEARIGDAAGRKLGGGGGAGVGCGASPARPAADLRKEATLRRHYYPEGGWGYVVVTCSVLVHFLGVGLQLAAPGVWHITAELKFRHPPLHSAGKDVVARRGRVAPTSRFNSFRIGSARAWQSF